MADEDIRSYLNNQGALPASKSAPPVRRRVARRPPPQRESSFKNMSATHMLCPKCNRATPVREKLLLYLPTGALLDYVCTICGSSCGTKKT